MDDKSSLACMLPQIRSRSQCGQRPSWAGQTMLVVHQVGLFWQRDDRHAKGAHGCAGGTQSEVLPFRIAERSPARIKQRPLHLGGKGYPIFRQRTSHHPCAVP